MKKYLILSIIIIAFNLDTYSQTKTVTVDANDVLNNNSKIVAYTGVGQSFFTGHQAGSGYVNSLAIFSAMTDNGNGASNYFYDGITSGVTNFRVRADGQGYFAGNVGIGTQSPLTRLHVV